MTRTKAKAGIKVSCSRGKSQAFTIIACSGWLARSALTMSFPSPIKLVVGETHTMSRNRQKRRGCSQSKRVKQTSIKMAMVQSNFTSLLSSRAALLFLMDPMHPQPSTSTGPMEATESCGTAGILGVSEKERKASFAFHTLDPDAL